MEAEDLLKRPEPTRPYERVAAQLTLPAGGLKATLAMLQRAGKRESGLIWYGPRAENGDGVVKLVVAPRQRMTWGNYHIPAEAVAMVVRRLPDDWRPLAQVHSHPGIWVEHSTYDDRMALSRRALSVVFPHYGHYSAPTFPLGVGVHEFQSNYWHLLPSDVVAGRILISDGAVQAADLR